MKAGVKKTRWEPDEEQALRDGVMKYGLGKWRKIQNDPELGSKLKNRSNVDLKDKWRNILACESNERRDGTKKKKRLGPQSGKRKRDKEEEEGEGENAEEIKSAYKSMMAFGSNGPLDPEIEYGDETEEEKRYVCSIVKFRSLKKDTVVHRILTFNENFILEVLESQSGVEAATVADIVTKIKEMLSASSEKALDPKKEEFFTEEAVAEILKKLTEDELVKDFEVSDFKGYKISDDILETKNLYGRDVGKFEKSRASDEGESGNVYKAVASYEDTSDIPQYLQLLSSAANTQRKQANKNADDLVETAANLENAAKIKRSEANRYVAIATRMKKICKSISETMKSYQVSTSK